MRTFRIGGLFVFAGLAAAGVCLLLRAPELTRLREPLPAPLAEPPAHGGEQAAAKPAAGEVARLGGNGQARSPEAVGSLAGAMSRSGESLVAVHWTPVYVSANPIDRNVFLETIKPDSVAASLLLADRVGCSAEICGIGCGFGLVPKAAIAWVERDPRIGRRAVVEGRIAARQGYLEHFLSIFEAGKDHESIVSASFDAQSLHVALLALGLKPGRPAQFFNEDRVEDFKPATGDPVAVQVEYLRDGQWVRHPAQEWVASAETKKPMTADWVFAGSFFGEYEGDDGKPVKFFAANSGRVICLTNFGSALLDVPFRSLDASPEEGLDFIANADKIPPRGTRVRVVLEPKK
jgi:hypothetical protein